MNDKITKLREAGRLSDVVTRINLEIILGMGLFWWRMWLLKRLLFFKEYSFSSKLKMIRHKGIDFDKKFSQYLFPQKYKIFEKYYTEELKKFGLVFSLDSWNYQERLRKFFDNASEIFYSDVYNVCSLVLDQDTVVDLGANIGLFSLYVKEAFPNSRIIAFEPEKENFEILTKNMSFYSDAVLLNEAAGEKNEIKKLRISVNPLVHSLEDSDFNVKPGPGFFDHQETKVVPLDIAVKERVDVVKIDVEGYEEKVLLGAKGIIEKYRPILLVSTEHFKGQRKNLINKMKQICSDYNFINLNQTVTCFYTDKHKQRISKFKEKCAE